MLWTKPFRNPFWDRTPYDQPKKPQLSPELKKEYVRIKSDPVYFIEKYLVIRCMNNAYGPFKLNGVQKNICAKFMEQFNGPRKKVRLLILKARQQGVSTICQALNIWYTLTYGGINLMVAQDQGTIIQVLFPRLGNMVKSMGSRVGIIADSATKICFGGKVFPGGEIRGIWARSEAENRGATYSFAHLSEVEIYKNWGNFWDNLRPAIRSIERTVIIIESTAQGRRVMWDLCQQNRNSNDPDKFEIIFSPWYETEEYVEFDNDRPLELTPEQQEIRKLKPGLTDDQMRWYVSRERSMSSSLAMRHEFPTTIDDCFVVAKDNDYTFFPEDLINAAINRWMLRGQSVKTNGRNAEVILGIDLALTHDHIAFVWRRGDAVVKIQNEDSPKDDTKALNLIARIIKEHPADKIYVDAGGIGGFVHDPLGSRGVYIRPINFGSSADEPSLYRNKRAEMYGRAKAWLTQGGMIPDNAEFKKQLQMIRFMPYENVLQLEPKKDLPYSPDIADAFVLTFQQRITDTLPVQLQYRRRGFMDEAMEELE